MCPGTERERIDVPVSRLEVKLAAYNSEFVILELLKSLLGVGVEDDTGSVDHTWAKEPSDTR